LIVASLACLCDDFRQNVFGNRNERARIEHVATKRLVTRGTADEPSWAVERCPFNFPCTPDARTGPNEQTLATMLVGKEPKDGVELKRGQLLAPVPKASPAVDH
jgi:hypothetical protein